MQVSSSNGFGVLTPISVQGAFLGCFFTFKTGQIGAVADDSILGQLKENYLQSQEEKRTAFCWFFFGGRPRKRSQGDMHCVLVGKREPDNLQVNCPIH